jgi:hypothetical protein
VPKAPLEALVGASKKEVLASCVKVEKSISDVAGNALPESVPGTLSHSHWCSRLLDEPSPMVIPREMALPNEGLTLKK